MRAIRLPSVSDIAIAISVIVLTSCSLVNPHVKWETPKGPAGEAIPASKFTLDDGIQYAENAKAAYKDALGNQSYLTSWLGIGLIPVGATALGLGMTGHSPTAVTVLGLTAASGYAVGTWLYSKPNQAAWVAGYNATTCAVDAILPLQSVEKKKDEINTNKKKIDEAIVSVENSLGVVRGLLNWLKVIEPKPSADLGERMKLAEQRVTEAEKLLSDSRDTRRAAEKMLQEAEIAGGTLKQTVDRISGKVSQQIVENAPDIQALSSMIGGLAQSYGQFVSVPEGLRAAPPSAVKAQGETATDPKVASLQKAIDELQGHMLNLQSATIAVAEFVNAITASKPIDTLKACGVTVDQLALPLTVEPSGRIELQAGKAATVGRVIRGGSAPFAVALQGETDGPMVRQTEPFGPAFTVQITEKTPEKEYWIYISDRAGRKLFLAVDVKSGTSASPPASGGSSPTDQRKTNLEKAAEKLSKSKDSFNLQNPKVNVTVLSAEFDSNKLKLAVDLEIKAQSGQTTDEMVKNSNDDQIKDEILKLKNVKDYGINNREDIYVRDKEKSRQHRPAARPDRLRRWIALTEGLTRRWTPGHLKEASHVFDRLLTHVEQMTVVREVVETRTAELIRAYRNVIDVGFGFRRKRNRRSGRYQIVRTPCVHFMVKRKWARGTEENPEGKIPDRLFAYCWVGGERRLCAVPTDVEDARVFAVTRPQAGKIEVTYREASVHGAIACGIQRGVDQQMFALSCRHVLSLSDVCGRDANWGATVTVSTATGQEPLGKTRAIAGTLQEAPATSFDAQLLEVTSLDALRLALDGIRLSSYAKGYSDLPGRFSILTPRGEVGATYYGFRYDISLYTLRQIGDVVHTILFLSIPDTPTEQGDSGSPVVSKAQDGMLLGMHIAGVENGEGNCFAYMIPAWQLFNPENYNGAANSEEWKIFNP